MKSTLLLMGLFFVSLLVPDISEVRADYRQAAENQDKAEKLYQELNAISNTDSAVLIGYTGATATLMAKYAKGVKIKTGYFKEGKKLIEEAIVRAPKSIELRYIRLSVQENAPKAVRYKKAIAEDKQFIIDNYDGIKDAEIRQYVKGFVSQSKSFTAAEKALF